METVKKRNFCGYCGANVPPKYGETTCPVCTPGRFLPDVEDSPDTCQDFRQPEKGGLTNKKEQVD